MQTNVFYLPRYAIIRLFLRKYTNDDGLHVNYIASTSAS
jgi:hypothetical protein